MRFIGNIFFAGSPLAACLAFCVIHALDRYDIASRSYQTIVSDGVERPLSMREVYWFVFYRAPLQALPYGLLTIIVLFGPMIIISRRISSFRLVLAYGVGAGIGGGMGALLSIVVWIVMGGWGPAFLYPAVAGGGVLGCGFVAGYRWTPDAANEERTRKEEESPV